MIAANTNLNPYLDFKPKNEATNLTSVITNVNFLLSIKKVAI